MNYDKPFLKPEQRVSRLFEINTVVHIEQKMLEGWDVSENEIEIAAKARMTVQSWANAEIARIETKYRHLAIENMARYKVTSWVK